MKIALDPALVYDRPIAAAFDAAAAAGYEYVELSNRPDFVAANAAVGVGRDDLRAAARSASSAGVEIASLAVIQQLANPSPDVRGQSVAWWRDGIHAAVELGVHRINTELTGNPTQPRECRESFIRSFEELLPTLEHEDIEVVVEPHPWDFLEETAPAVDLIREIGSPRLRYLHCIPHTFHLGGSVTEQLEYARGWFDHVHVADTFRPGRTILNPPGVECRIHQHFDIGRGEIPWPEVRDTLAAAGFDGILTVQVFCWNDEAEQSFRANRGAVDELLAPVAGGARHD
jgi:myo-inositol catabolism protein IolH